MSFGRNISPRTTAIATVITLGAILAVYWRLLVMPEPSPPAAGGGGPAALDMPVMGLGRADVAVSSWFTAGPGYRDGEAWEARFSGPSALAVAPNGDVLVADTRNHRIRRVRPDGRVSTFAGGADPGGSGGRSDGPAAQALLRFPAGIAAGPDGAVYVADTGNHRICVIRDGQLKTLAGSGEPGRKDGAGAAAQFNAPGPLAVVGTSVWVSDVGNALLRQIAPGGAVSTPPQSTEAVKALLGDLRPLPEPPSILASNEGWDIPVESQFLLGRRSSGAVSPRGTRYFADLTYHVLMAQQPGSAPLLLAGRRIANITSIGAGDGDGANCSFEQPAAVALLPDGNLVVAEYEGNRLRKVLLPEWLREASQPPVRPRRELWRRRRGS